jgi:lipoprotein NlpD
MNLRTTITCALTAAVLAACASKTTAPIVDRSPGGAATPAATPPAAAKPPAPSGPEYYTVKRGDTLYGIALDNGQDYRDIAAWNNIANVNVIQVGQVLRVVPPGQAAPAASPDSGAVVVRPITQPGEAVPAAAGAAAAAPQMKNEPNAAKRPYSDDALAQAQREAAKPPQVAAAPAAAPVVVPAPKPAEKPAAAEGGAGGADDVAWAWPASGKVIGQFTESGANKGVDIAAKVGDPVLAAGPGKVVYSGQGLRGYGRLIIIKHNNTFLSAYAHNSSLLVKEGQTVTKGQKIAEAGNTDSDVPKLHFEIRRQGKPVDPVKFLPER